jgi:predicted DNA-binding transcriptional regulator AlpA
VTLQILPRIIRHRDAPAYLGMDRNRFDADVRPYLTEIPVGDRGIGFDRLELDAWIEAYIADRGRPGRNRGKGENLCEPEQRGFVSKVPSESLTSSTVDNVFFNALVPSHKIRRKRGSENLKPESTAIGKSNFEQALIACGQMVRQSI